MSITTSDHRRFLNEKANGAAKETHAQPAPLLEQEESVEATTGDARLDKIIRSMEASIEKATEHQAQVAHAVCLELNADMKQKLTLEYMFSKGLIEAFRQVQKLPARILMEERG